MKGRLIWTAALLAVASAVAGLGVASSRGAGGPPNLLYVYNGPAIANTHATPDTPAFAAWCNAECGPSVTMPALDAATGANEGQLYVWTRPFHFSQDGKTICFGEFIWFALRDGDVYVDSGSDGTCGAFMDAATKPVSHIPAGSGQVIGGGGDGTIVGGTGRYAKWTGTYTDRVFVEFSFTGGSNYYDQLFWSLHRD